MPLTIHRRSFSPAYTPQDQQAYIAAQQAREAAAIQERAQRDQSAQEARQRLIDSQNEARLKAAATIAAAHQQSLLTKSNADWFKVDSAAKAKLEAEKNKVVAHVVTKVGNDTVSVGYNAEQFDKHIANKKLDAQIDVLKAERDAEDARWFGKGKDKAAELDKQIADLQSKKQPIDFTHSNDIVTASAATSAPAAPIAPPPNPQGFISGPNGTNVFSAEPTPLGMNRQQSNEWAAKKNAPPEIGNMWMPEDSLLASPAKAGSGFIGSQAGGANAFQAAPQAAPVQAPQTVSAPKPAIPKSNIEYLIQHPDTADQFDAKHGAGSAAQFLDQQQ